MNPLYTFLLLFVLPVFPLSINAQHSSFVVLDSGRQTSLRGLSVVSDKIIWASGSNGMIARSVNGGKTFEWQQVSDYIKRDFRDIEAFDENTAVIMGIAEPAVILKTTDGGKHWNKVFEDSTKGMFLDAMDFDTQGNGFVIGDPINDTLFSAFSADYGNSWKKEPIAGTNKMMEKGEAFFASSGTNIVLTRNKKYPVLFVSGGMKSRLNNQYDINIMQGKESTGANSIAIHANGRHAIIVGGDFTSGTLKTQNCILVNLGKRVSFKQPLINPHGYRSSVAFINKKQVIACGTSGVDISDDVGNTWQLISNQSFHVCRKAKKGNAVFLAGTNGKIARLQ